ncbi:hypothetical protein [Halobellus rarus]|uniref:Uncharacterized protein n=1 Tax=Halobellus rarus TaxID=1126237 RepID=A0ABD6CQI2_9EURY|nr:hypothetical protein [Halobellus rarus]
MSEWEENGEEHTLLLVEEDVVDEPHLYQASMLGHGPDSHQVEIVEDAMRKLVSVAEEITGEPHRFVKESDGPETIKKNFEMHTEDAEVVYGGNDDADRGDGVETDGGTDPSELPDEVQNDLRERVESAVEATSEALREQFVSEVPVDDA